MEWRHDRRPLHHCQEARDCGEDDYGNRYFEAVTNKGSYDARKRRYVIYRGYADASKIPPDWHGWMHYTFDEPPPIAPLMRRVWSGTISPT